MILGYYSKGLIIKSRIKIINHYLRNRFWFDITVAMIYIIGRNRENTIMQLIILFRYIDITNIYNALEERFRLKSKIGGIADLIKLSSSIIFLAHCIACSFHLVAVLEI